MKRFTLYLPEYQKKQLKEQQKKTGNSVSNQVRTAISEYLKTLRED